MGWMVIMVPTRFPRPYFSRRCGCEWSPQFNCFQIWAERGSRVKLRLIIVDTDNLCIYALFVKIPKFHPNQSPNILCQPLVGMFSPGTSPIRRWREGGGGDVVAEDPRSRQDLPSADAQRATAGWQPLGCWRTTKHIKTQDVLEITRDQFSVCSLCSVCYLCWHPIDKASIAFVEY